MKIDMYAHGQFFVIDNAHLMNSKYEMSMAKLLATLTPYSKRRHILFVLFVIKLTERERASLSRICLSFCFARLTALPHSSPSSITTFSWPGVKTGVDFRAQVMRKGCVKRHEIRSGYGEPGGTPS